LESRLQPALSQSPLHPALSVLTAILLLTSLTATAHGQASYPMLMGVRPAAAQIGQTAELEVVSRYDLRGANQVIVSGPGVTGEVIPPEVPAGQDPAKLPALDAIKVRFTVAADAEPGVRDFRLITPLGATTVGQLVLVRDPVIVESPDNDVPEKAQPITLPGVVCGSIEKAEDVDNYKFTVEAGAALSFHVRSSRLQNRLHDFQVHADPIITLKNSAGTVLELVDNYFFADPLLHYRFATAGEYLLEIRDVRYQGNPHWYYSIEISDQPFVSNVFPLAVPPGVESRVELIGHGLPADPFGLLTPGADTADGPLWITPTLAGGQVPPIPAPIVVNRLPLMPESGPENGTAAQAEPMAVPSGVNGRIAAPGDIDCYAFDAKAGEKFRFEVVARRHQSALDPIIRVLNADGAALIENDDLQHGRHTHADALIEDWAAPADGRYVVEVRDLHLRGGAPFVYLLKAERSEPYFDLEIDTDKSLLTPGTGAAIFVRGYRRGGFTGEIQLAIEGLPPGVTASCGRILADGNDGCIILQAAADAPRGAANLRITGSGLMAGPDGAMQTYSAVARPLQEIYNPGGGRTHFPVDLHTASISGPMDLTGVKLSMNRLTLKPGESQKIDITIERKEGFTGNVTLDCIFQHLGSHYGNCLPKGVTVDEAASKTLLTGGETAGSIVLKAAADAPPVTDQQLAVMANVSINFVMKYAYCAEPLLVTVPATEAAAETAAQ
jgi:hypothetical protein